MSPNWWRKTDTEMAGKYGGIQCPPPPHPLYSRSGYNPDNTSLGQVFIQLMFLCKILEIEMRGGGGLWEGGGRQHNCVQHL